MPEASAVLEAARQLNQRYLQGQKRRSGEDADEHSRRVEERFTELAGSHLRPDELMEGRCAARMHDLLEDGPDWNDPEALERARKEVLDRFGVVVLSLVEIWSVDPRLPREERYEEFRRRVPNWGIPECLGKWADIHDNARTRHFMPLTARNSWEGCATELLCVLIARRLQELGWPGELPPATLPPCLEQQTA